MNKELNIFIHNIIKMNKHITKQLYEAYTDFNYTDQNIFKFDLDYLMNLYNIHFIDAKTLRNDQNNFRDKIIKRDKCCVLSNKYVSECEAAHIVPVYISSNYDPDNGILLSASLHKNYDANLWAINPDNLTVELNEDKIGDEYFECIKYKNTQLNIQPTDKMLYYLRERYNLFKKLH